MEGVIHHLWHDSIWLAKLPPLPIPDPFILSAKPSLYLLPCAILSLSEMDTLLVGKALYSSNVLRNKATASARI
jgi:hypothetical protein